MALTRIELENKLNRLFDLREANKNGEKLTSAQYKEIEYYRDLLNEWFTQKASELGITIEFRNRFIPKFEEAEQLFIAKETGVFLNPVELPVERQTPTQPVRIENEIDPTNPQGSIRKLQADNQNVEEGTKRQDFSREQGTFNEFSDAPTFIETIKTTIAQTATQTPQVSVPPTVVVEQENTRTVNTIELLKSDISQILQTGEIQIQRSVELDVFNSSVYGQDVESSVRVIPVKQDSLDPTVQLIATAQNPYTVTQTQLAAESIVLLNQQEIADVIAEKEQEQIFEEQAAAVDSFTGGG